MIWSDGAFLVMRFGNMLPTKKDVGFDLLRVRLVKSPNGDFSRIGKVDRLQTHTASMLCLDWVMWGNLPGPANLLSRMC